MNLSGGAGDTSIVQCPGCDKRVEVYDRSFYGVGKKCPHCGLVFGPDGEGGLEAK